jgi:sigma-B regulation protein RsbU (phosphoserine phosphatase)
MAKLQSTLRAFAGNCETLPMLGSQVNRILCRDGLPGRFATLLFLSLRPDSGQVRIMNAGHMPPVALREGGLETLPPVAPVVGILDQAQFAEQRLALAPGDSLVVYSDGLTEAMNERNEFFGEERLCSLLKLMRDLAPSAVGARLLKEVSQFVGEENTSDDLSLIVIKRTEVPEDAGAGSEKPART